MLQEKALVLSYELSYDNFTASNGWLQKFQTRHNIKCAVLSGEAADVPENVVNYWLKRICDVIQGYELENIFNCDETGMFYQRILLSRSLCAKGDKCTDLLYSNT